MVVCHNVNCSTDFMEQWEQKCTLLSSFAFMRAELLVNWNSVRCGLFRGFNSCLCAVLTCAVNGGGLLELGLLGGPF